MGLRYKEKRCNSFGKDDTSYSLYLLDMLFQRKSEGLSCFFLKKGKPLIKKLMHVHICLLKRMVSPYTVWGEKLDYCWSLLGGAPLGKTQKAVKCPVLYGLDVYQHTFVLYHNRYFCVYDCCSNCWHCAFLH